MLLTLMQFRHKCKKKSKYIKFLPKAGKKARTKINIKKRNFKKAKLNIQEIILTAMYLVLFKKVSNK